MKQSQMIARGQIVSLENAKMPVEFTLLRLNVKEVTMTCLVNISLCPWSKKEHRKERDH